MNWILCFYLGLFCFNLFEILIVVYKDAILEKNSYLTYYKLMSFDDDTGYYNKTSYLKRKILLGQSSRKVCEVIQPLQINTILTPTGRMCSQNCNARGMGFSVLESNRTSESVSQTCAQGIFFFNPLVKAICCLIHIAHESTQFTVYPIPSLTRFSEGTTIYT